MSELNNIDRLFQEKFKDFEVAPSDKVWENIQSKMNPGEKEIKLLPLWLRLCSFIAVFLIGFSVATTFIAGPFGITNPLKKGTDNKSALGEKSNTAGTPQENTIVTPDSFNNTEKQSNAVVVHNNEDARISDSKGTDNTTFGKNKGNATFGERHSDNRKTGTGDAASKTKNNGFQKDNTIVVKAVTKNNTKDALALRSFKTGTSSDSSGKKESFLSDKNNNIHTSKTILLQKDVAATDSAICLQNNNVSEANEDENTDAIFDPYMNTSKVAHEVGNKYVQNKEVATRSTVAITTVAETKEKSVIAASDAKSKFGNGKSNYNSTENNISVSDTLTAKQNKIAEGTEAKKETEEKDPKEKNDKKSKWIVSTNFSPVYMNLNGSGSALDAKFDENSISYQTSMSYGVGLKYALDKKWSVRTGVNVLNFEYSTNDISYYYSSNGAGLEHVNENGNGTGVVVGNPNSDPKGIAYNDNGVVTKQYSGNLTHKINYVEVPIELTYKILNRKFGIEVIGGVSSLLMNDNKVSIVSTDSSLTIGEAGNLNKLHFSTNVGLGLRYSFMKNLHANVEPMLKYQINTYNGDAENFKPYFIGVYSGISYSF